MRVLVVEDERKVADALKEGLEAESYDVVVERTGEGAFYRASTEAFDLMVLDIGLPGRDGLEVLSILKSKDIKLSVIILSARDAVTDRVAGLNAGADDYLVKPFAFAELLARIRAIVRRGRANDPVLSTVGSLVLDRTIRKVTRGDEALDLTMREFELLDYLMRWERKVVSRESLARDVWKESGRTTSLDNVIDVHIARLRRKVESEQTPRLIHTIRGVGFMLSDGDP